MFPNGKYVLAIYCVLIKICHYGYHFKNKIYGECGQSHVFLNITFREKCSCCILEKVLKLLEYYDQKHESWYCLIDFIRGLLTIRGNMYTTVKRTETVLLFILLLFTLFITSNISFALCILNSFVTTSSWYSCWIINFLCFFYSRSLRILWCEKPWPFIT